jgi:Tfp pilus assembly protein PilW
MIAAALSTFVLAGVLSAFLMIGRTGYNASSYSELERETRKGLEAFAQDARQASDVHWNSSQSITLTLPTATNATTQVTYAYDSTTGSPTYSCFYRLPGAATSTEARQVLVHNVAADFAFQRYKLEQTGVSSNTAANDLETKKVQLTFRSSRTGVTTVAANQASISASYILRNKKVSN